MLYICYYNLDISRSYRRKVLSILTELSSRKAVSTTLSKDNVEKLKTLSKMRGVPQTKVLDDAVDTLYRKEESIELQPKHKGIVISIANNKGGVGKTTSAAAFADLLSKRGFTVLVIDADQQGNLSGRFGYDFSSPDQLRPNYLGNLIKDRLSDNVIHQPLPYFIEHLAEFPRIDIICSDIRLDDIYAEMNAKGPAGYTVFRKIINEVRHIDKYDYIIVDSRPAINTEVSTLFLGTDYVLIPIEPAFDSVLGANSMVRFVSKNRELNPGLKILGVFMTKVKDRTISFHSLLPMVQEGWDKDLFQTKIPYNQDVVNAENDGAPVTYRKPVCKASKAYQKLLDEVVTKIENA